MRIVELLHKIILSVVGFLLATTAYAQHPPLSGGIGSIDDPYLIASANDLTTLSDYINTTPSINLQNYYKVTEDIDMSSVPDFTPIGNEQHIFNFNIDGNHKRISGLRIGPNYQYSGLIGYAKANTIIKNIDVEVDIEIGDNGAKQFAGGLVAYAGGMTLFDTCTVRGSIYMGNYSPVSVGGLCGFNATASTFRACNNHANINIAYGYAEESDGIGGIIGYARNRATITECCNYGDITGPMNIGGIAGYTSTRGSITYCNNVGHIRYYDNYAGGIVGNASSNPVYYCCNAGTVSFVADGISNLSSLNSKYIGGIAGYYFASITNTITYPCSDNLNVGSIIGWDYTGGITGANSAYFYNNVNMGIVLDGNAYKKCKSGSISGSYNSTYVDAGRDIGSINNKQMTLLSDSLQGTEYMNEGTTNELDGATIRNYFDLTWESQAPLNHTSGPIWIFEEGSYPVPNKTDLEFNKLARVYLKLNDADNSGDVAHQFKIVVPDADASEFTFSSSSNGTICRIAANSVGLAKIGKDTLRATYKGMTREWVLNITAVDTLMFSGGMGTEEDPYIISCLKDLKELETVVANNSLGKDPSKNWSYDKWFLIYNDIKDPFEGTIGISGESNRTFQGHIEGNGKSINIARRGTMPNEGFISEATSPASIKNLEVSGWIETAGNAGGIVGKAEEIVVTGCLSLVNIAQSDTAGGIVAIAHNVTLTDCGNSGLVESKKLSGGLVGYANACTITNAVNGGSVSSEKTAGGIIGSAPVTTLQSAVNYGYVGRSVEEIAGTQNDPIVGDKTIETAENTHWNAQLYTIWDETWETEGISTQKMLTDATFKTTLGAAWETSSDTTLPLPKALTAFEGSKLLTLPLHFTGWSTIKDANQTIKIPAEPYKINESYTSLIIESANANFGAVENGTISPKQFGQDTINLYYKEYKKSIPVFITYGFLGGGNGTKENPYLIQNANDFKNMKQAVEADTWCVDTLRNISWHKYFSQETAINETITSAIGNDQSQRYEWSGHYDGKGNELNIEIEQAKGSAGLFAVIAKGGSVKNLTIKGSVKGTSNAGGVAGCVKNNASIVQCVNNATVQGTDKVGGLTGWAKGQSKINDVINLGEIRGARQVGGIAGELDSSDIRRSINTAIVKATGSHVGGIVGRYIWGGKTNMLIYESLNLAPFDNGVPFSGSIVGESVNPGTNITLCFYDNQLSLIGAVDGNNNTGFSSGLSTRELMGRGLDDYYYDEDYWIYKEGHYAQLNTLSGSAVTLASKPAVFYEKDVYNNLSTEFTVENSQNTSWSSAKGHLSISGKEVAFEHAGEDTLIAELDGYSKKIPVFITNGLFSGGNGTKERPYLITCKQDMKDLAYYVNTNILANDKTTNWSDDKYFSLENDIPSDSIITDIVAAAKLENSATIHFGGTFSGHGHKMNVSINSNDDNVGLFGFISKKGTVDSLDITGQIKGVTLVGGICGYNEKGVISNCNNYANVNSYYYAGGICGLNENGKILHCTNAGAINSTANTAGGISAKNSNTESEIKQSTNIGTVTAELYAGGISGQNEGNISTSVNSGCVIGTNRIGGICGQSFMGSIGDCIEMSELRRTSLQAACDMGYICGLSNNGATSNCYYDQQLCSHNGTTFNEDAEGHNTIEMLGDNLKAKLGEGWIYAENQYPRNGNSITENLASSSIIVTAPNTLRNINDEFKVYCPAEYTWSSQTPRVEVKGTKATLLSIGKDSMIVSKDDVQRKVFIDITCITKHTLDTLKGCDSLLYNGKYYFNDIQFVDTLKTKNGCDSIVGINITINASSVAPAQDTIWATDSINYKGKTYKASTNVTTIEENAVGCDSTIVQPIDIVYTKIKKEEIEAGCDSTLFDGKWWKADTTLQIVGKDAHDRDTLVMSYHINVNYSKEETFTLDGIDSLLFKGQYIYSDTLITDTTLLATGCNHITHTQINIGKTSKTERWWTHCGPGEIERRIHVEESGIIKDTLTNVAGFDSIITWHVTIMEPKDTSIYISQCHSLKFKGKTFTQDTVLVEVNETDWCDSTVYYHIHIMKATEGEQTIENCYKVDYQGKTYTQSTDLRETLPGANHEGCDSIVVTHIIVHQSSSDTLNRYGCDLLTWKGMHITNDTILCDTLQNSFGCDSFLYYNVHITHTVYDTLHIYGCDSAVYYGATYKGNTQLVEQKYEKNTDDVTGELVECLSLYRMIYVHVGNYQEYVTNYDDCEVVTFRGKEYRESTSIRDSFVSTTGCDSIMVYNIRIHRPKEGKQVVNGCGMATYKGVNYFADTTFTEHTTTKWGCDSSTVVNIFVRQPSFEDVAVEGCEMVMIDGEEITRDTIVTRVYTNAGGCDSTVRTHVTIHKSSHKTITLEGDYDVWYNGKKYVRSVTLHDTLRNHWGCDSFLTVAILVKKALDYPIIVNKYDYMLLCNNNIGQDKYTTYQWYKDGKALYNETKQYYNEPTYGAKLNGCYQVYVTTNDGKEYFSEEVCFKEDKPLQLYPNPVQPNEAVTIDYEFTEKEKDGLYIDVYNSAGLRIWSDYPTSYPIVIPGIAQRGYYFVLIMTGEEKGKTAKFIVK